MTFAEYNTDENFKGNSTADELVKLAFDEGRTRDDVETSLSPLWKEDKKGNVKKALDKYYKTAPKEEVTEEEKVVTPIKEDVNLKKRDKEYLDNTNVKATYQEQKELDKVIDNKDADYAQTFDSIKRSGEMFRSIDDHMVENLPTFMFRRYQNGEFGDPKGKDAKLRMAYFMINGLGTALQNASASIKGGQMRDSDYETYKKTNLAQGLENRWNKYRQDTQAAIDLAKNRNMTEEEAYDSVRKIARNQRLQTAFNMMNEDQKLYLMNVTKEIGDKIGSFSNDELIDFLTGAAVSGDKLTWQEAAAIAIARFGPDAIKAAKEGKGKISGDEKTAGASGNNLKGYQTIDGETVDFNMIESKEGKAKLRNLMDDLSKRYYNEEIDEDTFRKYYEPLYLESRKHVNTGSNSTQQMIDINKRNHRTEINNSLNELQDKAKQGVISPSDYKEQFDNIVANFKKWGLDASNLAKVEKSRISQEKILKNVEKANKKKK